MSLCVSSFRWAVSTSVAIRRRTCKGRFYSSKLDASEPKQEQQTYPLRETLSNIGVALGNIKSLDDWYFFRRSHLQELEKELQHAFNVILRPYSGNLPKALEAAFPEHTWLPWRFWRTPKGWTTDPINIRKMLIHIGNQLGVQELSDWYKLTRSDVEKIPDGKRLVAHTRGSWHDLLLVAFHDHAWDIGKFEGGRIRGLWDDQDRQRKFFEDFAQRHGTAVEDLLRFSIHEFIEAGGTFIHNKYSSSVYHALTMLFPSKVFLAPKRQTRRRSRGILIDCNFVKQYVSDMAIKCNVASLEDWYSVPPSVTRQLDASLLSYYGHLSKLLEAVYPDHSWEPWKFSRPPREWWKNATLRTSFMHWLARELDIDPAAAPEQWLAVNLVSEMKKRNAHSLARVYAPLHARCKLFQESWPTVDWEPLMSARKPNYNWRSEDQQRQFLEELAGINSGSKDLSLFYKLSYNRIVSQGGGGLLGPYDGSLFRVLKHLYPDHEWLQWKFRPVPRHFWASTENQKAFMDWCARQLGVKSLDDWYNITLDQITKLGGRTLVVAYFGGSLMSALAAIYYPHRFDTWRRRIG